MNEDLNIPINKLGVKGRATVQVFDEETGELVEEQQHDNYISPHYLRVASMLLPRNLMINSTDNLFALGGTTASVYNSPANRLSGVINKLLLTSSSDPINQEYDTHIKGNIIGVGQVGLASSDDIQSVFNTSESVLTGNYKKFVYDFATNQGNGTFQSIYTGNFALTGNTGVPVYTPSFITALIYSNNTNTYSNLDFSNGHIYYLSRSSSNTSLMSLYRVKVPNFSEYGAYESYNRDTFETEATDKTEYPLNLNTQSSAIRIVNGLCYLLHNTSALYRVTLTETPVISTLVSNVNTSLGISTSAPHTKGLLYESNSNTLLFTRRTTAGVCYFTRCNLDGTLHSNTIISTDLANQMVNNTVTWSKHHEGYFIGDKQLVNPVTLEMITGLHSPSYTYPITHDLVGNADGTRIKCGVASTFFSRVLLDSPVTKTSANSMKITYEFFIEPPAMKPLNFTIPTI